MNCRSAGCKMRAAGLAALERTGGFGDRHLIRRDIARTAVTGVRASAAARSQFLDPADVVLVGDTPSDVRAAHAAGARCLAMSTGGSSSGQLQAAGPDGLVGSLADVTVDMVLHRVSASVAYANGAVRR